MSLLEGIVSYGIIWFVCLFTVLPWGVRTQQEEGEVEPGTVESAPVTPSIWKKFLATSILAGIIFAFFWAVVEHDLIDLNALIDRYGNR